MKHENDGMTQKEHDLQMPNYIYVQLETEAH